jgi:hypothetical protein
MLDHDHRDGGVGEQPLEPQPPAAHACANLGDHLSHGNTLQAAHSVSRATCRSRSARWSWSQTRTYSTARPPGGLLLIVLTRI